MTTEQTTKTDQAYRAVRIEQLKRSIAAHDGMMWTTPLLSQQRHREAAELAELERQQAEAAQVDPTTFKDFFGLARPAFLAELGFDDLSWHNDAAARSERVLTSMGTDARCSCCQQVGAHQLVLVCWTSDPDPRKRDFPDNGRFLVLVVEQDGDRTDVTKRPGADPTLVTLYNGDSSHEARRTCEAAILAVAGQVGAAAVAALQELPAALDRTFEVEHDLSGEPGWGSWLERIAGLCHHAATQVQVQPNGPGGGNPCLTWTFGDDADRTAVREAMRKDGWEDLDLYFQRSKD